MRREVSLASRWSTLICFSACALGCSEGAPSSSESVPASTALQAQLQAGHRSEFPRQLQVEKGTKRFYQARDYQPAWTPPAIDELVLALRGAESHGLSSQLYNLQAIVSASADPSADPLALDILCTDSFLALGSHLAFGQVDPKTLEPDWRVTRRSVDVAGSLTEALDSGQIEGTLDRLSPQHEGYARLRDSLRKYRSFQWDAITVKPARELRIGETGPLVVSLRKRLAAEGFLKPSPSAVFDEDLGTALGLFQSSHGLAQTNTLTSATLVELNVDASTRAQQISANLERWRWMPDSLGETHIVVNIPDYRVSYVARGNEELVMKGIVGKYHRQTPVFSGDLFEVLLNPSWGVPKKIAIEDKLPLMKKDRSYLEKHNFQVFKGNTEVDPATIDWKKLGKKSFPYQLRQRPGSGNALGRVKFNIRNEFSIYLHDTPDRQLFSENDRSFSSGCIRLERPRELAALLLHDAGWTEARIDAAIKKGASVRIKVKTPIPVHLQYFTAWTAPNSPGETVSFRRDIYGRDATLLAALHKLTKSHEAAPLH